ncbi:MAG: RadC family protein [Bacteroidales bacterium]
MKNFIPTQIAEVKISYSTNIKANERLQIKCSGDAYEIFASNWNKSIEHTETMMLLILNRANRVLGITTLSQGGTAGCLVDVKIIMQYAIKANATSMVLAHNHPSGSRQPSDADLKITRKVKSACEILDLSLLDHIILTPFDGYTSFADEGFL